MPYNQYAFLRILILLNLATNSMYMVTHYIYIQKCHSEQTSNVCTIPVGGRLNNFKILIGQNFSYGETQRGEIESWNECASFSGK